MVKRTQTELDTSVRATFKDGTSKDFASIEEASNGTGISVAAIKIRCNKPGTGGKDKTTFEFEILHTGIIYLFITRPGLLDHEHYLFPYSW